MRTRQIGIIHRVKQTAKQEARPTMVCIRTLGTPSHEEFLELKTETDELDFLLGRFPVNYRDIQEDDDRASFFAHQIKWVKCKEGEEDRVTNKNHLMLMDGIWHMAEKVPSAYEGLSAGDVVLMCLGGSGDRFGYAIARHGLDIGAKLLRLTPKYLKQYREGDDKTLDHQLLIDIYSQKPEIFQGANTAEMEIIRVRELFDQRMDSMGSRIECEQRLRQRLIGKIFLNTEGKYPEGALEDLFDADKASDIILRTLQVEERARNLELKKAIEAHPLYIEVFKKIDGFGIRMSAPMIAYIGNILRFENVGSFKQYCGVAPNCDGEFQRKKRECAVNWRPEIRQALYLFSEQMNRKPKSVWGKVFLDEKARLRAKHPDEVTVERPDPDKPGKTKKVKLFTKGHIHNKARWHALGKFAEWLYGEWTANAQAHAKKATETKSEVAAA